MAVFKEFEEVVGDIIQTFFNISELSLTSSFHFFFFFTNIHYP